MREIRSLMPRIEALAKEYNLPMRESTEMGDTLVQLGYPGRVLVIAFGWNDFGRYDATITVRKEEDVNSRYHCESVPAKLVVSRLAELLKELQLKPPTPRTLRAKFIAEVTRFKLKALVSALVVPVAIGIFVGWLLRR